MARAKASKALQTAGDSGPEVPPSPVAGAPPMPDRDIGEIRPQCFDTTCLHVLDKVAALRSHCECNPEHCSLSV